MNVLEKVFRGDDSRRSRLHSQRGERASALALAASLARRNGTGAPWMVPGAVSLLDKLLKPSDSLLELGSGYSTAWYANRVGSVVSIEPDQHWSEVTRGLLRKSGVTNVDVKADAIQNWIGRVSEFNCVVIDFTDLPDLTRGDFALRADWAGVDLVVFDDTDRARYADGLASIPGRIVSFTGFKGRPLVACESSVVVASHRPTP